MTKALQTLPLWSLLALAAGLPGAARAQADWPPALQTIVVSATRLAMALIDAPAAMSVVNTAQIAERGADNVFEALGGVVNIITRAPGEQWALRTLAEGSWADGGLGGDGHRAAVSLGGPLAPGWRLAASVSDGRRQAIDSPLDARIGDIEGRDKWDGALRLFWTPAPGHEFSAEHREGQEDR